MQLTQTIGPGARLVRQGLQDLSDETPKIGRQKMYDGLVRAKLKIITYPPERSGQRYVRTYTYERAFTIVALSNGWRLQGQALSPKGFDYTSLVGGSAYGTNQAWMHAGRFNLIRDAVDYEVAGMPLAIRDAVVLVARRNL